MADEDIKLQRDREFINRNSREGVDMSKYSFGQIRALQLIEQKAKQYVKAGVAGAAVGAVAGAPLLGIGAVPGAVIGFFAGIGVRSYGAPADAIDTALERFNGDLEEGSRR